MFFCGGRSGNWTPILRWRSKALNHQHSALVSTGRHSNTKLPEGSCAGVDGTSTPWFVTIIKIPHLSTLSNSNLKQEKIANPKNSNIHKDMTQPTRNKRVGFFIEHAPAHSGYGYAQAKEHDDWRRRTSSQPWPCAHAWVAKEPGWRKRSHKKNRLRGCPKTRWDWLERAGNFWKWPETVIEEVPGCPWKTRSRVLGQPR